MGNYIIIDAKSAYRQANYDDDSPYITTEILKCMYKINTESNKGNFKTYFLNLNENTLRYLHDRGYSIQSDTSEINRIISWETPINNSFT